MKTEFWRGVDFDTGKRLWHYNDECEKFPTRNFAVRLDRPSDDEGSRKDLERAVIATAGSGATKVPSFAREWRAR